MKNINFSESLFFLMSQEIYAQEHCLFGDKALECLATSCEELTTGKD